MVAIILLGLALLVSLGFNVWLFLSSRHLKKTPPKSYDATQLMHDLTAFGYAMVKVERVDQADIFLRSPRDRS